MRNMTTRVDDAEIVRELQLAGFGDIHGVTCDDRGYVWFAHGDGGLACVEPASGRVLRQFAEFGATAGTTFDGTHLWQITRDRIVKLDPESGEIVHSIPQPDDCHCSGMAWAEGSLWVGNYDGKQLLKIDPVTGAVRKRLDVDRFVTGVTWIDGELWHGVWAKPDEADAEAELRVIDTDSGQVRRRLRLPARVPVSGVGADAQGRLWCGGSAKGGIFGVRR